MNQRPAFSRTKESRREKIIRTRRDDGDRFPEDDPPSRRSSSERPNASSYPKYKDGFADKFRTNSRETMVFRRQERGKLHGVFPKSGEVSPCRAPPSDSVRNDGSGRSNYISSYSRGISRDYGHKRPGYLDNSNVVDESRLKSFLHRLLRDEDKERQASLIRQLRAVFEHPDNYKIIQVNKDDIISTFEDFIQLGLNSELRHEFVLAVGALGATLGHKAKSLLDWEFTVISTSKCEDIRIIILKSVLEMLKLDAEKKNLSDLVPFIMSKLQSALEVADIPDLLVAIVNVISEIANRYPSVFSNHFSDTVDILIGWHIDATQQQSVIEFTSSTLIGFQQFWIADIHFTVTLLGQFLEDMESYAEELAQSKLSLSGSTESQLSSPEENIAKIKSLIKVLITVLRSIGDLVALEENGPISPRFVLQMLKGFLKYVKITMEYCYYSDLMTSANECLVLLLRLAQSHTKDSLDQLVGYVELLQSVKHLELLPQHHLASLLSVLVAFVKAADTHIPLEFVSRLFAITSVTHRLRHSPSIRVQKLLIELYHVVLSVKSVQLVEEFYRCLVLDITQAHSQLLSCGTSPEGCQAALLLGICALVQIGNVKHSLIRMFALKPSYFELMTTQLQPTNPDFAKKFPALQSAILFTLYSHCQRHSHFVSSSSLVSSGSPIPSSGHNSPITPPSPSSGHLERVVQLLVDLLEGPQNSFDCRLLTLKWSIEILESMERYLPRLVQTHPFSALLRATLNTGFSHYNSICKLCCKSLHIFLKSCSSALSDTILQKYYDLCILRLNSHDPDLQEQFASLLALIPLDIILRGNACNISKGESYLQSRDQDSGTRLPNSVQDTWTAYRGFMGRSASGNFFSQHFRAITGFILQGKEPQEKNWLLRLYSSCPPPDRASRIDPLVSHLVQNSTPLLWFWGVWEVAQACVASKLRTPLGKPQETFMAIEAALKSAAKPSKSQDSFYSEAKHVTLLRHHLLLSLLEHLEKQMYNAYEGCASALISPPKNVRTFFRTNKSTCLEWIGRVRSTAVIVALNSGSPAAALRHGFELLQELKNSGNTQGPELEGTLYAVVRALILLRCPEAMLGLYIWCKENLNRKYTWIKASVDCAAGKLENAVKEYQCILQSLSETTEKRLSDADTHIEEKENDNKLKIIKAETLKLSGGETDTKSQSESHLNAFLMNQVIDCYAKLQNWSQAVQWSEMLENKKFNQNGLSMQVTSYNNNLPYLRCLSSFEEASATFSKKDASTWLNNLTNSESQVICHWTMDEQFGKAQRTLMSAAIQMEAKAKSPEQMKDQIFEAKSGILKLMKISTLDWPLQIDSVQASLFLSASAFQLKGTSTLLQENVKLDPSDCYSSVLGSLLTWENIWLRLNPGSTTAAVNGGFFDLHLAAARLARKQHNLKLCRKWISKALGHLGRGRDLHVTEDTLASCVRTTLSWPPTEKLVRVQRETAKLFYSFGEKDKACDLLLNSISVVSDHLKNSSTDPMSELNSRSMLNLVKYMLIEPKTCYLDMGASKEMTSLLNTTMKFDPAFGLDRHFENGLQQEKVVSDSDFLQGQILQRSVHHCPLLAKSWCHFAAWCYSNGRKVINTACNGSLSILPEEKARLFELLPDNNKEDMGILLNIVTSLHNSSNGEWDNQEMDCVESGAEEVRWQLATSCPSLQRVEDVTEGVVDVWKGVVGRLYSYYRMAAASYLRYLKLNGQAVHKEDDNVTATLRLLRLVVKHASELRDVLEEGLAETPTAPWRGIIPQLFSRLNHPEPYVRHSISDLLSRVAIAAPHLIVFPAVVGSLTLKMEPQLQEEAVAGLLGAYFPDGPDDPTTSSQATSPTDPLLSPDSSGSDKETGAGTMAADPEEEHLRRQKTAVMQNCFSALVETLGAHDQQTISEAKGLVHELHRVTLLWDELWLGTLGMHQGEVNRRFLNLEKEISKVFSNAHLTKDEKREIIKEKHSVYVKPTLFLLEQLQTISSQPAETPHEQWFQKTFEKIIEEAIAKLRCPEDPSRPQESWHVFKQLHHHLQQKVQQQQSRSHLSMDQISPLLANLRSTVIPMPGINKTGGGGVCIQSVHNAVSILPTKTKPKKLAFFGSDGHRYTYLFKGLEDLHLDERIMQFLSIVNNMFAKSKRHGKQVFYARHYSVTPLGPRSGLIQWVDGATPLFGLYKRWQQREANSAKNTSGNMATVLRPSEIFYNKLTPLLKEKNINSLDNRKEWPLSVLLDVLKQLMDETADNLLAKELWCSCSSAQEWWNVTLTYNHSTAVMSIIGYIIGLGDRHLDNVLVDLATGEVVHIDYNVCFEKGKNLRVPEKVPFRMTPNIKTALGITGIEGVFRTSCEHVLKVLRRGRETLLTLLEAFVYDPLVEWTPGSEGGYTGAVYGGRRAWGAQGQKQTRQGMEVDIALSMFAIRVTEMKGEWTKNRDDLLSAFPQLERLLGEWRGAQLQLQEAETELQEACQEKALLEEALSNPHHNLYTLPNRYDEAIIVKTTVAATKDTVVEKLNECRKWHKLHSDALSAVCGSELSKVLDVSGDHICESLSVEPVVEFLQSAGQGQLVQQCEHAESELASVIQQRKLNMRNCFDLLTTYATIILQFGPGYRERNRSFRWQQWLEGLLQDFSSLKCLEILADFRNHYGRETPEAIQTAISYNLQFQTFVNDASTKVLAVLDRMRAEGADDKNTFAKETNMAVLHYLTECGESCHLAFLCVMVEALCTNRKQFFLMETAAAGASSDRLIDLTSWNADWFLDEISGTCRNIAQYAQLLLDSPVAINAELKQALLGVKLAHFVFTALEDLGLHFQNIILPEALQSALEPSVVEMVAKLDRIIARCGMPLDKLVAELQTNITHLLSGAPVVDNRVSDIVKKLRNEFESLMQRSEPNIIGLNQGQMLLMGFNGLFTKVDSDLEALLAHLEQFPSSWKKMDFYSDTIALTPATHHPLARPILRDIYFVHKLSAIQQAFHGCQTFVNSLQPHHAQHLFDPDTLLVKPIRQFSVEYVRHIVLGLPSQALGLALCHLVCHLGFELSSELERRPDHPSEELFLEACKGCISRHFLEAQVPPLTTLLGALDGAWRKEDMARRLDQYLVLHRGSQQRAQLQLARFQWLNEDLLLVSNAVQSPTSSSRASIMSEIRKTVSGLVALDCVVNSAQERYLNLTAGIEQRLKWAAGANPSLAAVQEEFEAAIAAKTELCASANQVSQELVNVCNSILHFEALRTRTTEALSSDTVFLALITRCKETCELAESCQSQITNTEEHLISFKPLDKDGVTQEWLTTIMQRVSLALGSSREKLEHQKGVTNACWESLHLLVAHMHELISIHHKLMSEVRHILRNLAKHEEQEYGSEHKSEGPIHQFTSSYREFSERLSALVSKLLANAQEAEVSSLEREIPDLSLAAKDIYERLVSLAGPLGNRKGGVVTVTDLEGKGQMKKGLMAPVCDSVLQRSKTSRSGTPKKCNITRDPRTGKAVQEKNTYATNIWKRIKMKLDGKDPEPSKKSTIPEQVDFVIREATHMENLAVLYEGWTPWV
ncbi:hypothetical protein JTE90_000893 [Oedothorax gibbosus]|uniref:non-specific serine/threonine protein kinase n=1 Tax=Oedothorax gibbosus TaxID=931172 RepID=A0AAV6VT12_9ARAC|nr:hypothetical protein JTE90_000893 [Oedothorax gibbosus]